MKHIDRTPISSWLDLCRLAEECHRERWIFRGENKLNDSLRPKAGRVSVSKNSPRKKPYSRAHEEEALREFKRRARPYLGNQPVTGLEWLAVAQHHGMSTRLLDWSESILVACYFAVDAAGTRGPARIYGAKALPPISAPMESKPFDVPYLSVYQPPHIAPRIPAQRSVFTIGSDVTEDISNHKNITAWEISESACSSIKLVLDACGVNDSSLFPDLDGLSRYIGWKYKWGKF